MSKNPLSAEALFEHVQDLPYVHVPPSVAKLFGEEVMPSGAGHIHLPQPLAKPQLDTAGEIVRDHHGEAVYQAVWAPNSASELVNSTILPLDFVFTKFMMIELLVAVICLLLFGGLAAALRGGKAPKGWLINLLETFLVFIRDEIARPAIGKKDADRFVPFLWTLFFFVLGCNLFGMIPWMGSPTGALAVTGSLALVTFLMVCASGIKQLGFVGFLQAQAPTLDLPLPLKVPLLCLIWPIEVFGLLLKHCVLAIRLLANMVAGHLVLAVLIGFIGYFTGFIVYAVTPASIAGATAMSVLELFVAFLQAYIFTFLSALFIGAAVHPH